MARSLKYGMTLLLVSTFIMVESCFASPLEHWSVQVFNDMQSHQTLSLHCKSKDDDLGQQNLRIGEQFSWRFRVNLWQTTLYWCYMHNQHSHVALEVFWPESHMFLSRRCKDNGCIWYARDDGIYLKNVPENKFELQAKWQPGL